MANLKEFPTEVPCSGRPKTFSDLNPKALACCTVNIEVLNENKFGRDGSDMYCSGSNISLKPANSLINLPIFVMMPFRFIQKQKSNFVSLVSLFSKRKKQFDNKGGKSRLVW